MKSSSHIVTTNKPTPNFLRVGCPFWHPTNSIKALILSLCFNGHFPGEPGLAGVY